MELHYDKSIKYEVWRETHPGYFAPIDNCTQVSLNDAEECAKNYARDYQVSTRVVRFVREIVTENRVETKVEIITIKGVSSKPKGDAGFIGKCGICNDPNCDNPSGKH